MKTLKDLNVENKKVIIRVDFNVPIKEGKIVDDTRIVGALSTINHCLEQNAKVILLSHLGRVKEEADLAKNDLAPVAVRLEELLGKKVTFINKTRGEELENAVASMQPQDVVLVQNTRYEDLDGKKESKNDPELAKNMAKNIDVFVMDAFGSAHRAHSSTYGVPELLNKSGKETAIGFLMEKEIVSLTKCVEAKAHPYVAVLGGAKVSDKINVIEGLLNKADKIIIGGAMAYTFLKAKGVEVGIGSSSVQSGVTGTTKRRIQGIKTGTDRKFIRKKGFELRQQQQQDDPFGLTNKQAKFAKGASIVGPLLTMLGTSVANKHAGWGATISGFGNVASGIAAFAIGVLIVLHF